MVDNNILNLIQSSKVKATINPDWYYYSYQDNLYKLDSILASGYLKCRKLQGKHDDKSNCGNYFIQLCKMNDNTRYSLFNEVKANPLLIISDSIKAYHVLPYDYSDFMFVLTDILRNSRIPIRMSYWKDEYQAYMKIPIDKVIGIYYTVYDNIIKANSMETILKLRSIVELLDFYKIDIPIIDGTDSTIIDKKIIRKIDTSILI